MPPNLNRRSFLGAAASGAALSVTIEPHAAERPQRLSDELASISLSVNGQTHRLAVDPRVSLLDALACREEGHRRAPPRFASI